MIEDILCRLGLSKNEIKVYMALLEMHKSSVTVLGGRTNLNRDVARYTCVQLMKKGLIQEKRDGKTFIYYVESPERLSSSLEEKKAELSFHQSLVQQNMGLFRAKQNPMMHCPDIKYYEGRDGIVEIYEDILQTGEDVYCWTNFRNKIDMIGEEYIFEDYIPRRMKKGIKINSIEQKTKDFIEEKEKYKKLNVHISFVDFLPIENGEVRIYGKKVAIFTFCVNKPIGFIFESKEIATVFKSIFDGFWKLANQ